MTFVATPNAQPLPGYRLLSLMGQGGFGEVWKCEAPGGLLKAIKFVAASTHALEQAGEAMEQERAALSRLRTIRHPFLLSVERVEVVPSGMLVVMELADENLRDVFDRYREAGEPGIPRDLLLDYFDETAEALDLLNWQHDLIHLDVKPDNVFLVADHAKLGDFGLVTSLPEEGQEGHFYRGGGFTPAYAAPEVWAGQVSRQSDQYSLAITWCELRTGGAAFHGNNSRQLMLQHATQEPNLSLLPSQERWAVARALAKAPPDRFGCCKSFLHALRTGEEPPAFQPLRRGQRPTTILRRPASRPVVAAPPLERQLAELIGRGSQPVPEVRAGNAGVDSGVLRQRFVSPQLRGLLRMRLDKFKKFWGAAPTRETADHLIYRLELPLGFRSRYPLGSPILEVEICLTLPHVATGALTEVEVRVRAAGGGAGEAERQMLREVGPLLLESLRSTLDLREERRGCDRVEWTEPLVAWPVWLSDHRIGDPFLCRGRDISLQGVRMLSPVEPSSSLLRVQLGAGAGHAAIDALARVVRVLGHDGGFDVGAQFCTDAPPSLALAGAAPPAAAFPTRG